MSRPIMLTDELRAQALKEFADSLAGLKMADGKVCYTKAFTYEETDKVQILFTPEAYTKMITLLMSFDSEVAWHGCGYKDDTSDNFKYVITDILVYPQTVSGATVEMDTEEYAKWLQDNDEDDRFNNIIMQGHSHVNMNTSPSPVDTNHQDEILCQLTQDMFYIFMIWNKKMEHWTKIYDIEANTLYEEKDITYGLLDEDGKVDTFLADSKKMVVKKTYTPITTSTSTYTSGYTGTSTSGYTSYSSTANTAKTDKAKPTDSGVKSRPKEPATTYGNGWQGRGYYEMDDEYYGATRFDT